MASEIIELEEGVWAQVTATDKDGSIFHKIGAGKVVYIESDTFPTVYDANVPIMEQTSQGDTFPYYGVATGDDIYAISLSGSAVITKSPKGV